MSVSSARMRSSRWVEAAPSQRCDDRQVRVRVSRKSAVCCALRRERRTGYFTIGCELANAKSVIRPITLGKIDTRRGMFVIATAIRDIDDSISKNAK